MKQAVRQLNSQKERVKLLNTQVKSFAIAYAIIEDAARHRKRCDGETSIWLLLASDCRHVQLTDAAHSAGDKGQCAKPINKLV